MAIDKVVDSTVLDGYFTDIADAIRFKNGAAAQYTPAQMPSAIKAIVSNKTPIKNASSLFYFGENWPYFNGFDFTTGDLENCEKMFHQCFIIGSSVTSLDLSDWDVSNVVRFNEMFSECHTLETIDLSNWDTSTAWTMEEMFSGCFNLRTIIGIEDFDFSSFVAGSNGTLDGMFKECQSLQTLDLSNWNVDNVGGFYSMFEYSTIGNLDISTWVCPNARNTDNMFYYNPATSLDLSSFAPQGTGYGGTFSCSNMFSHCYDLQYLDLSSLDASKIGNSSGMFDSCSMVQTAYCRSAADKAILDQIVIDSGQSWTFTVK